MFKVLSLVLMLMFAQTSLAEEAPLAIKIYNIRDRSMGTAFNYRNKLITAAHVCEGAVEIEVRYTEKLVEKAKILALDATADTCVIEPISRMPKELKTSKDRAGVIKSIGFPGASKEIKVIELEKTNREDGLVCFNEQGLKCTVESMYKGSIFPGMSGGPAINEDGEVVGINSISNRVIGLTGLALIDGLDALIDRKPDDI